MKRSGILAACLAAIVGLAGCGDGGLQSPDFTPVLQALSLDSDAPADNQAGAPAGRRMLASGRAASLDVIGTFSTPPGFTDSTGQPAASTDIPVTNADFTLSPDGIATIQDGMLVGNQVGGVVTVTANRHGVTSNSVTFRIAPPVLTALTISPDAATISVTESTSYSAQGTFSDGMTSPVVVDWSITPAATATTAVATLAPANGQSTVATPVTGSNGESATITASVTNSEGTLISDDAALTISNEFITALTSIRPNNPSVSPGTSVDFTAVGTFSNGTTTREGDIPDSQVVWSVADSTIAEFSTPADLAAGIATGLAPGGAQTTIRADLIGAITGPVGADRFATTSLTVTTSVCPTPLLAAQGATTSVPTPAGLCVGCSVSNAGNVIDGNASTFGSLNTLLGLLGGSVTLNVDSNAAAPFVAPARVGFVVAQPPGLLSLELLSNLSVSTRLGGQVAEAAGATQTDTLDVALLGLLGGQEAALISFVATQPYDGIALTFNAGVASLLPSINAFQACAVAVAP